MRIADAIIRSYQFLFARKPFLKFNKLLYHLSLRGLGVLNFETDRISGEAWFLKSLSQFNPRMTVLDVGANVGNYSSLLKSMCPNADIIAFEPHPKTYEHLKVAAQKAGFVAINKGCSDTEGSVKLYDYSDSSSGSEHASLYAEVIEQIHHSNASSWDIKLTSVDIFLQQQTLGNVTLLKIDTEGNELKVIRGAKNSITDGKIEIIHFEFNQMSVISRIFMKDFYEALSGYKLYRMLPDGLIALGSYDPMLCEIFAYQNIIAVHAASTWQP